MSLIQPMCRALISDVRLDISIMWLFHKATWSKSNIKNRKVQINGCVFQSNLKFVNANNFFKWYEAHNYYFRTSWHVKFETLRLLWKRLRSSVIDLTPPMLRIKVKWCWDNIFLLLYHLVHAYSNIPDAYINK